MAYDELAYRNQTATAERADSRAVFGQTMGLVAFTCLFAALGAYVGRDTSHTTGFIAFIVGFGCLIGMQGAIRRSEQLAITLLFAVGFFLGLGIGPVVHFYADSNPGVVYQAAGATALFIGGFGAYGYATSRDLTSWGRTLFWALIALLVFGLVAIFVAIPGGNVIWALLGLTVFAGFTMFDFNRLRRSGIQAAPLLAASIFLDILNVFQFMLLLFGGGGNRR